MVDYANYYVDLWLEYEISMFEIEVFIAIMYFINQNVDLAIFEVGLGGTLDATNIIMPKLAINTNIGLDHIDYLGDTYQSIALNLSLIHIFPPAVPAGEPPININIHIINFVLGCNEAISTEANPAVRNVAD